MLTDKDIDYLYIHENNIQMTTYSGIKLAQKALKIPEKELAKVTDCFIRLDLLKKIVDDLIAEGLKDGFGARNDRISQVEIHERFKFLYEVKK